MKSRKTLFTVGTFAFVAVGLSVLGGTYSSELFVLIPIFTLLLIGVGCLTVALVPVPPQVEVAIVIEPVPAQLYNTKSKHYDPGFLIDPAQGTD